LLYNSWSSDKNNKNDARDVNLFSSIKNWVDIHFKNYNKGNPKILYHPTVLMQIGYKNYIFILKNASYDENRKYKLIFNISTKQINSKSSNIRKKIPEGKFKRVRFDIDSFDKINGNLINNLVPRIVYDGDHFKIEQNHYYSNIKLNNNPNLLVSRNVKKRGLPTEFTINSQIEIWDQGAVGDCAAEATCFLYTYIMAVKDVDFTSRDGYNKSTLRPLTDKFFKDITDTSQLMFRTRHDDPNCFFSRFFIMWAGYHTPIGNYDYKINAAYNSETLPTASSGSYILNNFIGLQSWGGIPLLSNNIEFTSKQDFSEVMKSATKYAFNGINLTRSDVDALTKNELDDKVSKFNDTVVYSKYSYGKINPYWSIQKNNNFKIYTVKQEEDAIISVLSNGYPITVTMTIFNIGLNDNTIGLVVEDGLIDVLQYTDSNQTINNIKPGYHAVVAIGYTKNPNNNRYYVKIRNSWGLGFGTLGCFYMPMSFLVDERGYCSALYTIGLSSDIPSLYFDDPSTNYIFNKTKVYDLTKYVHASRTNIGITYEISAVDSSNTTATLNGTNLTINSSSDGFCTITAKQGTGNPCTDTFPEQNSNCYLESSITFKWEQSSSIQEACNNLYPTDDNLYYQCVELNSG